jgi:hypothetical protein
MEYQPGYEENQHPPAGNRIPCSTSERFPSHNALGHSGCYDVGSKPLYIGSVSLNC